MTCGCDGKPKYSPGDELVWFEGREVPKSSLSSAELASLGLGAEPMATASSSSSGTGTGIVIGLAMGLLIGGVLGVYLAGINEDDNARRRRLVDRRRAAGYAY